MTCHIPYANAQDFIRLCLDTAVSPVTVRKAVDRKADQIRSQPVTAKDRVVYEDSTKVKAGDKDRGISINGDQSP